MIDTLTSVSPDLAQWMITEGYGKTLSRPGCDTVTRELCIVAMLSVLGRRQQLTSHVRGALRAGATIQDLKEVEHAVTERCGTRRSALLFELILLQERRLTDG
jgi:4-carboxymuconolactone decarboxylase